MKEYCDHDDCRQETKQELYNIWLRLPYRNDVLEAMHETHYSTVRCRKVPRKGAVLAPFPTKEKDE